MKNKKLQFFAQYFGQDVFFDQAGWKVEGIDVLRDSWVEGIHARLKPISQISDEDAIEVGKLCYPDSKNFIVDRRNEESSYKDYFLLHIRTERDRINLEKHISINRHCAINANWHFGEYQGEKPTSHKINLGEQTAQNIPIPMYAIVDFLRSKGYAIPFLGLSIEEMEKLGWIKIN